MDATAISLCMDNKLPILVFNLKTPGNIRRVVMGEAVGRRYCVQCKFAVRGSGDSRCHGLLRTT